MDIWITIPFFIILLVGLILTAVGLFGNIVVFGAAILYAFLTGFHPIGIKELLIIGLLYGSGELIEYVFTLMGVKWLGASRASGWMAIVGTLIGATFGGSILWGTGIIIGGFLGAMLGALITELIIKGEIIPALRAALGAFIGKTGAMFVKLTIVIIIIIFIIRSIYANCSVL